MVLYMSTTDLAFGKHTREGIFVRCQSGHVWRGSACSWFWDGDGVFRFWCMTAATGHAYKQIFWRAA